MKSSLHRRFEQVQIFLVYFYVDSSINFLYFCFSFDNNRAFILFLLI